VPWETAVATTYKGQTLPESADLLPLHLGWGSEGLTALLRRQQKADSHEDETWLAHLTEWGETAVARPQAGSAACDSSRELGLKVEADALASESLQRGWVKLYPDIGLGMLRQELTAPGRLWLMLRYLDEMGQGVLRVANIKHPLTDKSSTLRLCGKRQLRNLLQDGEGVFWQRDKTQVWLYSAAKVAYNLDVERLTGKPVALPTTALLAGIGTFRAHLYTAFHSGRSKETPYGEQARPERSRRAMPIARDTLTALSGVGRSSQRAYEDLVGLDVQTNFAVGEVSTKEKQEKRAWQQGQALFELKDYRGHQGKKGRTYLAWQLPNSYLGQHQHRPKGRQKRINRKLKDLVTKGMPGNIDGTSETRQIEKVYYPTGMLAAKAYGRNSEHELYWQQQKGGNGRFAMWQQLGCG
jgi:hypothetical protein